MIRDHAGHTWTYDPAHRRWHVENTRLVVYVGGKGSDGHTSSWLDGVGLEYPSLGSAMTGEADHHRQTEAHHQALLDHSDRVRECSDGVHNDSVIMRHRFNRARLACQFLLYVSLVLGVLAAVGWLR